MQIFVDESGELGFSKGSSKHYVIACVCSEKSKTLSRRFKKFRARLIGNGWPKELEPKASRLFGSPVDKEIPKEFTHKQDPVPVILGFLEGLSNQEIEIDIFIVKKDGIYEDLRTVPFGILNNYYSREILIPRIIQYENVNLIVDQRSKERHAHLPFNAYITTEAFMRKGKAFNFNIHHGDSNVIGGISTADYVSWAVFRKFEFKDDRFFEKIHTRVVVLNKWFF